MRELQLLQQTISTSRNRAFLGKTVEVLVEGPSRKDGSRLTGRTRQNKVVNFEGGVNWNTQELSLQANLYAMEFTNEIALTGELSEVGLPLRRNVDNATCRRLRPDAFNTAGGGQAAANRAS